jgi:aspartyl-tRNA(Asn)/glutamyl-tRNA(Gln) amidotransferase subunit C
MTFSTEDVDHLAQLARLGLSDEEKQKLGSELSVILDAISKLQEVDTAEVPETAQVGELVNAWRDDVPEPSIGARKALLNAPATDGKHFAVGAIQDIELDQ